MSVLDHHKADYLLYTSSALVNLLSAEHFADVPASGGASALGSLTWGGGSEREGAVWFMAACARCRGEGDSSTAADCGACSQHSSAGGWPLRIARRITVCCPVPWSNLPSAVVLPDLGKVRGCNSTGGLDLGWMV
jgi:hypothetical protein